MALALDNFIPGAKVGDCYKYENSYILWEVLYKADPYAFGLN